MSTEREAISTRGVAAAAGLWVAIHALMALLHLKETSAPLASLTALILVLAATAWAAAPLLGYAPWLSVRAALALGAVPVLASVSVTGVVDGPSLPGYGSWWPGAVGPLLAALVLRGHRWVAAGSATLACAAMVALVFVRFDDTDRAPVVAVTLVVPPVLWTTAAIGVRWLLDRAEGSVERYTLSRDDSRRREEQASATERSRTAHERRLREDVVPVLEAAATGDADDRVLRDRFAALERSLRDDFRRRRLLDADVRREVERARSDGVRVSLADDCEGPLTDAEADLARRCVLATLAALEAGELSARLPGGQGTLLTIVVATGDVSACSAAVATVAGERALVDADGGDLFVQVPRG